MSCSSPSTTPQGTLGYTQLFSISNNLGVLNAYFHVQTTCIGKTKVKVKNYINRINLIRQLLETHNAPRQEAAIARPVVESKTESAWPSIISPTLFQWENGERKNGKDNVVCAYITRRQPKRKDTMFECVDCKVALRYVCTHVSTNITH